MNIAYKYRFYPTTEQKIFFIKTFGCCRKIWNLMLEDKIKYYKADGSLLMTTPASYKKEYPYLKETDSLALANIQLDLEKAYKAFFRDPNIGFPNFKSKRKTRLSYTTNVVGKNITISDRYIKLPKVGYVKVKRHRKAPDDHKLKSVTVSCDPDGKFYASVLYEYEDTAIPVEDITTHIGLDYKSDGLYVDSEDNVCNMPHYFRESEHKLAKAQRVLSRRKGSKKHEPKSSNYKKQQLKVSRIYKHISNQRKDFLHKKSNEITNRYDIISVEDLNMKGMSRSLRLGKSTMDNGYGMFVHMLEYKQQRKGHYLVKIDKWFPSSQLCQCGYKNPATKNLGLCTIICPACGRTYDRDANAAQNIDAEGLRLFCVGQGLS